MPWQYKIRECERTPPWESQSAIKRREERTVDVCQRSASCVCSVNTSSDLLTRDGEAVSPKAWTLSTPNTFAQGTLVQVYKRQWEEGERKGEEGERRE